MTRATSKVAAFALVALACGTPPRAPQPVANHAHHHDRANSVDDELEAVARVHGAPGPWAVLGYRMGKFALAELGLAAGSFDLDVVHHTPNKVQFSCIADGVQASTHASAGKLNLHLREASEEAVATVYTNKRTGVTLTLAPTELFRRTYANAPRERARELGREVLTKPDTDLFERR